MDTGRRFIEILERTPGVTISMTELGDRITGLGDDDKTKLYDIVSTVSGWDKVQKYKGRSDAEFAFDLEQLPERAVALARSFIALVDSMNPAPGTARL